MSLLLGPRTRVYLALEAVDMRRGFDGLAAHVQSVLRHDPFEGALLLFRGKRGDRLKILHWDGSGLCLYAKRLERGRFVWPGSARATVVITQTQLTMLVDGHDWRQAIEHDPVATPQVAC